ncbi:hypothetical protein MM424_002114, partial [Salmonella enterica]|nr:hypothetical protein [Salmonella enterica]
MQRKTKVRIITLLLSLATTHSWGAITFNDPAVNIKSLEVPSTVLLRSKSPVQYGERDMVTSAAIYTNHIDDAVIIVNDTLTKLKSIGDKTTSDTTIALNNWGFTQGFKSNFLDNIQELESLQGKLENLREYVETNKGDFYLKSNYVRFVKYGGDAVNTTEDNKIVSVINRLKKTQTIANDFANQVANAKAEHMPIGTVRVDDLNTHVFIKDGNESGDKITIVDKRQKIEPDDHIREFSSIPYDSTVTSDGNDFALVPSIVLDGITNVGKNNSLTINDDIPVTIDSTPVIDNWGSITVYGNNNNAAQGSVIVGNNIKSEAMAVSIGDYVITGSKATGIGNNSTATGTGSVAIGANAIASNDDSVALGNKSITTRELEVSVGGESTTRFISGVSDGERPDDAVNKSQLDSVLVKAK